jgi:hypothetical protein
MVSVSLSCDIFAFAIEFHDQYVVVTLIGDIHQLVKPIFQYSNLPLEQLMEWKVCIRLAFTVESRKTLPRYDVAFESTDLTFV